MERAARVLDGAVIVIDAVSGVQAQTQTVWKQIRKQSVSAVAFVNKMDRSGASFRRTVASIRKKLSCNAVPIQMPIGAEDSFEGCIDLLMMRRITWVDPNQQQKQGAARTPVPATVEPLRKDADAEEYDAALRARHVMLEAIAEADEEFFEYFMSMDAEADGEWATSLPVILAALRRCCTRGDLVPTLCGAALRGKGVEPLLDSVLAFLPSPLDRPAVEVVKKNTGETRTFDASADDLCAMAFKVTHDAARGPLIFTRVYSGQLKPKQVLFNSSQGKKERVNQLLEVSGDDLDSMPFCGPGSVCCIVGLKHTTTGDTLVADGSILKNYVLSGLTVPPPVFSLSIEPELQSQQAELDEALRILCMEDPSLRVETNKESGQLLIHGIGELHLEIVCDRLQRQFGLQVTTGRSYVAYRESLDSSVSPIEESFTFDKTIGGKRMFAGIDFHVTVAGGTAEPVFSISKTTQKSLSAEEFNALNDALNDGLQRGPRGYPIVGLNVTVQSVMKDSDTSPGALRACAVSFLNHMLRSNSLLLLEPIMHLEVEAPERYVGDILSDLTVERRAHVGEVNAGVDVKHVIHAEVPLSTMLGYASKLRSMTQGEGTFSTEYSGHQAVDPSLALL